MTPIRGDRKINPAEAEIIRRIFEDFAAGKSPIKIARTLNEEQIPGPRGALWRDTAIRGHRIRGTGILNNEIYIGKLVWNRLRYIKDPNTGKRVSRRNSEDQWVIEQVPDLRIINDSLWEAVKARQQESDAQPHIQKIKQSRFWEHRRAPHLLSGLNYCGHCKGRVVVAGRDYLACSNARKLKTCKNNRGIKRMALEDRILNALKKQLMQPECVKVFMTTYHEEVNRKAALAEQHSVLHKKELAQLQRKHTGLINAIADGLRTAGLKNELEALEAKIDELEDKLRKQEKPVLRLHPNLANLYQEKVANLHKALESSDSRQQALDIIRGLIEKVIIREVDNQQEIELIGDIARMVEVAHSAGQDEDLLRSSTKVVAGVGFKTSLTCVMLELNDMRSKKKSVKLRGKA